MAHKLENTMLTDRRAYSVFILTIKGLKGSKLEKAIYFKLVTVFPGDIENYTFDYRRNGSEKDSYIVFVIPKALSENAQYLSTLILKNHLRVDEGVVCFIEHEWFEICIFSKNSLKNTYVKNLDSSSVAEEIIRLSEENPDHVYIVRSKRDTRFPEVYSSGDQANTIFSEDLFVSIEHDAVFIKKSPEYSRKRKIRLFLLCLIAIGCILGILRYHEVSQQRDFQIRQSEMRIEKQRKEQAELVNTKTRLQDELTGLLNRRTVYPFDVMQLVAVNLDNKTQILSATFKDGFFQIEAVAQDALQVLQRFEENNMITNILMRNVSTVKGVERFSMSASVEPDVSNYVEGKDLKDDIDRLKLSIEEEKIKHDFTLFESRSEYAAVIRKMLRENSCVVKRYNFIQTDNGEEIEYSVIAANDGIARFLTSATRNPARFRFTQIQIRNLTPTPALDVTFRIQTTVPDSTVKNDADAHEIDFTISRITEIKKNYYARSESKPAPKRIEIDKEKPSNKPRSSLMYVGAITGENGKPYIYAKLHNGDILAFQLDGQGDMSCKLIDEHTYEATIDSELYEIKRGE